MPTAATAVAGSPRVRPGTAAVRLLLLVLLTVGIVGMHTLGHPEDDTATAATASAVGPAAAHTLPHDTAGNCPAGHCASPDALMSDGVGDHPSGRHGADSSGHGTDPASMCLAVFLAALGALLLGAAWLTVRRRSRGSVHAARAWWSRLASGLPPPERPDLSRLQVLRI
ncbi:DUF6153 family protein [Yinghuangia sp. ASG 101]|uniref:DUF6153 family protein n=1 Tax=Yinghuangia sp. ASG 101 TaxID=2896848 RepID=UPI001E445C71|nr:DUF6153 family protein [Yinghuangia sp. ASG 101]UGQ11470.1 DUF6153 family protein [Yinghuangia sp. ASG 101]